MVDPKTLDTIGCAKLSNQIYQLQDVIKSEGSIFGASLLPLFIIIAIIFVVGIVLGFLLWLLVLVISAILAIFGATPIFDTSLIVQIVEWTAIAIGILVGCFFLFALLLYLFSKWRLYSIQTKHKYYCEGLTQITL